MPRDLQQLKKLKETVDEILDAFKPGEIEGAINWADLRCVEALHCVNYDGQERLQVLIEEAAPEEYRFQLAVGNRLKERGWGPVNVVSEW